jgi:hypothetical protein
MRSTPPEGAGMTWQELAVVLLCTPSQLTGPKRVRFAIGMKLAMMIAQWLERPAADFVCAAGWWTRDARVDGDQSSSASHH